MPIQVACPRCRESNLVRRAIVEARSSIHCTFCGHEFVPQNLGEVLHLSDEMPILDEFPGTLSSLDLGGSSIFGRPLRSDSGTHVSAKGPTAADKPVRLPDSQSTFTIKSRPTLSGNSEPVSPLPEPVVPVRPLPAVPGDTATSIERPTDVGGTRKAKAGSKPAAKAPAPAKSRPQATAGGTPGNLQDLIEKAPRAATGCGGLVLFMLVAGGATVAAGVRLWWSIS